jgi:hypothetical protein
MKKIIIILLISTAACDLLDTREPETPNVGGNTFVTPTTPDILFHNLAEAFQDKILENYMACFVDAAFTEKQFKFVPSAGSISQFEDWNLESERSYFNNLRTVPGDGIPITLTLTNEISNTSSDSAVYQFDYSLIVPIAGQQENNTYRGKALFRIYQNSNQWSIGEWEDIKIDDFPSWSELKGRYY